MRVQLTKVLTGLSVISALCFLGDAPPAFAAPAPTCAAAIYSSGSNYCSLSAGQTITFVLKAGNGGRGGDGGMGGMGLSSGAPGGIGGAGGTGGSGGSGAKTSFTYTNTTGSTITLRFNIGVDGSAGTNGLTGGLATPGGNGGNGGDGTETAVLEGLTPIAQTSPGLGGFGGTGGSPGTAGTSIGGFMFINGTPGAAGVNGSSGADGTGGTLSTSVAESPNAEITLVSSAPVSTTPATNEESNALAVTGIAQDSALRTIFFAAVSLLAGWVLLRRRQTKD